MRAVEKAILTNTDENNKHPKYWKDKDVLLEPILNKTIAVIGYGIQGRAQACNLKDSGINVIVGLHKESKSKELAVNDGQKVMEVCQATKQAHVIHILVPDMEQGRIYKNDIEPYLSENAAICFSHGAAIHWKWIIPPSNVDVIMVAPKGPGQKVRELFKEGFGIPSLVAVYQNHSHTAWDKVLAISKGIGSTRPGVIKTDFKEEVETDCFGEQVILCGGVQSMIVNAFEILIESGYQPEVAYFECLHELKLIVDLIYNSGLTGMYNRVSETARYGGITRGERIIDKKSINNMKKILNEIQSGQFAKEWIEIYEKEKKQSFQKFMQKIENHRIEKIGKDLREIMYKKIDKEVK
ncbi:MAG TPA: ketol-acid reductoisomerase [Candidatus Sulfopaludibacter sp.]|jgi:ketol-acid reductoisomerase|nr:ketol-acid reductoisomerase [Candidatus Sulfopaludibacter sp.]